MDPQVESSEEDTAKDFVGADAFPDSGREQVASAAMQWGLVTNNGRIKNFAVSLEHFAELVADSVW